MNFSQRVKEGLDKLASDKKDSKKDKQSASEAERGDQSLLGESFEGYREQVDSSPEGAASLKRQADLGLLKQKEKKKITHFPIS